MGEGSQVYRSVFKIFVSLALALGLTTAVVSTTSAAQAAPASAGVSRAAVDCSSEQSTLDTLRAKRKVTKQKLAKAKRIKKRTVAKLRRAKANDNRARVIKLKRKVRKLNRQIKMLNRRLRNQSRAVQAAKAVLAECQNGTGGAQSPIQDLCDTVPQLQPLCDAIGGGALPGLGTDSPLQSLCDAVAQLQPLCDAAGGSGLPTDLSALGELLQPVLDLLGLGDLLGGGGDGLPSLDALCGAGLPLPAAICDALGGEGVPTDLPLDQLCTQLPGLQALCDALEGGGLPTDPSALTDLLQPIFDVLGIGGLLDDILGGGLGGLPTLGSLCGTGLPLPAEICDALGGEGIPTDVPLDQVCAALSVVQPLCDALEGGGLPADPEDLTGLLSPILDALGLGDLLDDLLGGLLGGGILPRQAAA